MRKLAITSMVLSALVVGCNNDGKESTQATEVVTTSESEVKAPISNLETNPFFSDYNTPFGMPPFDKITN